jgi:alkylhydroperoxidase family enzyme
MAVAAKVGCGWCLDVGYFQALNQDLDQVKASQVPDWRESSVFTPLKRDVLEYAEAMSDTPLTVTDELYASLLDRLGPAPDQPRCRRGRGTRGERLDRDADRAGDPRSDGAGGVRAP